MTGVGARIVATATHVPERRLTNDDLAEVYPDWSATKIFDKTGIRERRIAASDETALDLGVAAAMKLLAKVDPSAIDFVIFCSQAPDYILPTSACLLQHRLALPTSVGALDINLGCSGYVYALSIATGLIASGSARGVMIVTADTYSKYIHPLDRSVRTLFGDGAAASLVVADDTGQIGPFVFGTDGAGADRLIVEAGGHRRPASAETAIETVDRSGNVRTPGHLYMDGAAVMNFTLRVVPQTFAQLLERTGLAREDIDHVVLHQANRFMLDALQKKLKLADDQVPRGYEMIGNTVASTIPFVLAGLAEQGRLGANSCVTLIGFGVGLSWAGTVLTF